MKAVVFTRAALKAFGNLPKDAQAAIVAKLERYAEDGVGNTRALSGRPGIRIRIGNYRAVFVETEASIEVFAVGDRRSIYG